MDKFPTSLWLSPDSKALITALTQKLGIPKTAVYEMAIRMFAKEHKCEVLVTDEAAKA